MRLHLDTSNTAGPAEATNAATSSSAVAKPGAGPSRASTGQTSDAGTRDSVAVSGASNAWSASFSDRAARVGQLTAAVRAGTYQVSSAAVSQSIVASATA